MRPAATLLLLVAMASMMMTSCQVAASAATEGTPGAMQTKRQLPARRLLTSAYVHAKVETGNVGWDTSSTVSETATGDAISSVADKMEQAFDTREAAAGGIWGPEQGKKRMLSNVPPKANQPVSN